MSFSTTSPRNDYIGNGATSVYAFGFRIFAVTDLLVTTRDTNNVETTLSNPTGFTVPAGDINNPNGGNITLVAGNLTLNYALTIRFKRTTQQDADLRNQGAFNLETIEDSFDKTVRMIQQNEDVVNRSLHLPETEAGTAVLTTLPANATRKSKFLAFDALGNPIASAAPSGGVPVSTFMETVLDDITAAAGRTTLGAAGSGAVTASGITMNTGKLLGRTTASSGAVEEIDVAGNGVTLSGGTLTVPGLPIAAAGGTVDAITADFTTNLTLTDKTLCAVVAAGANTSTTPTFAPDGVTARTIVKHGGSALAAGDIAAAGHVLLLEYNLANTRWELLNPKVSNTGTLTAGTTATMNPFAVNTKVTQAHSLGAVPVYVDFYAECLTAEQGYSVGDRVVPIFVESGGYGAMFMKDATNIVILAGGAQLRAVNFTTLAGSVALTSVNWKVVAVPYKLN